MELARVLRIECIAPNRSPENKDAALREVARRAKASPALAEVDEGAILEALRAREGLGSTGFGKGIAIPHCRLHGVDDFVVGILTVPDGVDFEALDGVSVRVIAFIVAPLIESTQHIRLLSSLSQILLRRGMLDRILDESEPEAIRSHILELEPRSAKTPESYGDRILLHIFIQDEEVFHAVLQILAGIESCSTQVIESRSERAYLTKMPLFADFWTHGTEDFGRIIVAVGPKSAVNEIVRQIEGIAGPLDESEGILVAIQHLFYAAGALGI